MNQKEAIEKLKGLEEKNGDNEDAHLEADAILLEFVPPKIRDAYIRTRTIRGFWYA